MTERAVIYGRASRDPKATGTSVTKQLDRGRDWALREGVDVVAEVRDDDSSAARGSKDRPGFARVRDLIDRHQVDLLILWEVSRSSRDLEEFVALINQCGDRGVALVVAGTRYDPRETSHWLPLVLQGAMAEAEARTITKRNRDSVETNARRGTPHGRIPYGYRRIYDPKTGVLVNQTPYVRADSGGTPVLDAAGEMIPVLPGDDAPSILSPEAQVLHDAVHAVLAGVPLRRICRDLTAAGVPSPRKPRAITLAENPAAVVTHWEPATLRQLLRNPTIAGRRVHRGEDIGAASWAPIVDYDTWLRLNALLADPSRLTVKTPRGPEPQHLLSGVARCDVCGGYLKATRSQTRMPRAYVCRTEGCMAVTVNADRADEAVEAVILRLFARPDVRGALTAAQRRADQTVDADPGVADLIRAKDAELAEVHALRDAGELTLMAYAAETKRIETALEDLRTREVASVSSPALRRLLTVEALAEGWGRLDLMDRRELLRLLVEIRIKKATKRGRVFDPTRVAIVPSRFFRDEVAT